MQEILNYLSKLSFTAPDKQFWQGLWPSLVEIAKNPSSNIPAAVLIFTILTVLLLIVGIAVVYFVIGANTEDEDEVYEFSTVVEAAGDTPAQAVITKMAYLKDPLRRYKWFWGACATLVLVSVVGGFTTQDRSVCVSCHTGTPHVTKSSDDPHKDVTCVRCHEGGGIVGSLTLAVPSRISHIVQVISRDESITGYGAVSSAACRRCHENLSDGVQEIADRGLRMSHKEPLAVGAQCLDCHVLDGDERVAKVTTGMSSCLRCHNGSDTSADCAVCHTGDVSQAVVATHTSSTNNARVLVPNPSCYSCHDPAPCDSCHGARLPHPSRYASSHMRDAAESLWTNEGRTCFKCHNDQKRSCYATGCHEYDMPLHSTDPNFRITHGSANSADGSCDQCHNRNKEFKDTCAMCH